LLPERKLPRSLSSARIMRAILLLSAVAVGHALRMAVTTPMVHRAPLRLALTPMMAADDEFSFGDAGQVSAETGQALVEEERELTEKEKEIARLRAAEKFMMRDTGDALCSACGYKYQMQEGVQDRAYPIQRNTPFDIIPDGWACPNCKAPKAFFTPIQIEIAGFEENQAYGIGANTWTEAQKSNAIFGGLGLFFLLFIAGYGLN
jgi:rubredoxin